MAAGRVLTEIRRHYHCKDPGLASRIKISGLSPIGSTWFEVIVGSHRQIQMLVVVTIEIAEHQAAGAVWIRIPALERGRNALSVTVRDRRVHQVVLGRRQHGQEQGATPDEKELKCSIHKQVHDASELEE